MFTNDNSRRNQYLLPVFVIVLLNSFCTYCPSLSRNQKSPFRSLGLSHPKSSHTICQFSAVSNLSLILVDIIFVKFLITMASNAIIATLANIVACSPCAGTFGRWKKELQDDDADLWNDLTLFNSIPNVKPPDIPKVVEVVSCSDGSDEDVSTLANENSHYSSSHYRYYKGGNKSFSSLPRGTIVYQRNDTRRASRYHTDPDPELEQVLEEIETDDEKGNSKNGGRRESGDAELESIMGPRSQISISRSHASRSIRRASSDPVVPTARPPSLLQQQREHFHSATLVRHPSDDPLHPGSKDDAEREYRDNTLDRHRDVARTDGFGGPRDDPIDCDGSSYSSAYHKVSFFKRKRYSFFRTSGNSGYKKAGSDENWLLLEHSGDSTEDTTVSTAAKTKNSSHWSHSRLRYKAFR